LTKENPTRWLPVIWGQYHPVSPAVIDYDSEYAYSHGQCFALAYEYMKSLTKEERATHSFTILLDKVKEETYFVHAYIKIGDGQMIDIQGIHPEESYLQDWAKSSAEKVFYTQELTYTEMLNWKNHKVAQYLEKMYKQRWSVARTFVKPLKQKIRQQLTDAAS